MENMADLLAEEGDLTGALTMAQQASDKLREGGQRHYYADTLVLAGQVFQQRGDLDHALRAYVEARSLRKQLGEKGPVADTDLALAELYCDSGKPAEAEARILGALPELRAENDIDQESRAQTVMSRALLAQGKLDEAQQAVTDALELSEKSTHVAVRLAAEIQNAYVRSKAKEPGGAAQSARNAIAEAGRLGFVRLQFEASLALAEIQMKGSNPAVVRTQLAKLAKNARARGFELIAQRADTAR